MPECLFILSWYYKYYKLDNIGAPPGLHRLLSVKYRGDLKWFNSIVKPTNKYSKVTVTLILKINLSLLTLKWSKNTLNCSNNHFKLFLWCRSHSISTPLYFISPFTTLIILILFGFTHIFIKNTCHLSVFIRISHIWVLPLTHRSTSEFYQNNSTFYL
jgi:hypothetical protein